MARGVDGLVNFQVSSIERESYESTLRSKDIIKVFHLISRPTL
jgi:hypothetical protein